MVSVEEINKIILKHFSDLDLIKVDSASTEIVELIIKKLTRSKSQERRFKVQCGLTMEEKQR